VARRVARGGRTIGVRRLRDRRRQLRVARRDAQNVATREGEAPDRDSGRVDSRQGRGERDRGLPVGELIPDAHDLARLATALPEMAVVDGEDGEPGVVESLREQVGARFLGHRATAGHDHARAVDPWVVPRSAVRISAEEVNLLPLSGHPGGLGPAEAVGAGAGGHGEDGMDGRVLGHHPKVDARVGVRRTRGATRRGRSHSVGRWGGVAARARSAGRTRERGRLPRCGWLHRACRRCAWRVS
jgi:hypothetical protein